MPSKMSKRSKFTTQGHEEMQLQCNKTEKHDKSDWHISHNAHQNAFETLIQYIKDEIVAKKKSTLSCRYQQILCATVAGTVGKFRIIV